MMPLVPEVALYFHRASTIEGVVVVDSGIEI
jgi:hypothetical protein